MRRADKRAVGANPGRSISGTRQDGCSGSSKLLVCQPVDKKARDQVATDCADTNAQSLSDCRRFFLEPASARQRQYEALRAYFVEERPSREVARAFGYSPGSFQVLCHHFRLESEPEFFVTSRRGPQEQPKKSAARELIIELRKRNYSVYEISETLKERGSALSATAVREVLKAEGFTPLPGRRDEERPQRARVTIEPVADVRRFAPTPCQFHTRCGGLFLFVPQLLELSLDALSSSAHLPGSKMIPAAHALRASLALSLMSGTGASLGARL